MSAVFDALTGKNMMMLSCSFASDVLTIRLKSVCDFPEETALMLYMC